ILNAPAAGQGTGQVAETRDHASKDRESLSKTIRRPSKRCRKFDRQGLTTESLEDRPNESGCHDLIAVTADRPADTPHCRRGFALKLTPPRVHSYPATQRQAALLMLASLGLVAVQCVEGPRQGNSGLRFEQRGL